MFCWKDDPSLLNRIGLLVKFPGEIMQMRSLSSGTIDHRLSAQCWFRLMAVLVNDEAA